MFHHILVVWERTIQLKGVHKEQNLESGPLLLR
jgi:hypothetical protein